MSGSNGTAGKAWAERAAELARWTAARLVVRRDAWGAYGGSGQLTLPARKDRGKVTLTDEQIERHYRAAGRRDVLGLHLISPQNTCLCGALDIDRHGAGSAVAERTEAAALHWYERQRRVGFRPLLYTSNGVGGFHERTLFRTPAPSAEVYAYLGWLTNDHEAAGLPHRPECFPKQKAVTDRNPYGNWLRLPGRHHSREHWSRVWDGSRWLEGAAAVDFILSLDGDDPDLMLTPRIEAYIATMPNLSEGNGRDDRGYNLAAFLVRDLALDDARAREWLTRWDSGNRPPKREEDKWLANAHQYGRNAYGSGRDRKPDPGPSAQPGPPAGPTAAAIIAAYWRKTYEPKFRSDETIYSAALGRPVRKGELLVGAPSALIDLLAGAADEIATGEQEVPRPKRPGVFKKWGPTAWADLWGDLPDETAAPEVVAEAAESFRAKVARGLLTPLTLSVKDKVKREVGGKTVEVEVDRPESRAVIAWARTFAKPGKWEDVRRCRVWGQLCGNPPRLRVALRPELFGSAVPCPDLARLTPRRFADLCEAYGIGTRCKVDGGAERAVELDPAFVDDLLASPELGPPPWANGQQGQNGQTDSSRAREGCDDATPAQDSAPSREPVCPSVPSFASVGADGCTGVPAGAGGGEVDTGKPHRDAGEGEDGGGSCGDAKPPGYPFEREAPEPWGY